MSIRVILADDHPLVLDGLRLLLEGEPDLDIVAACGNGPAALEAVRAHRPDVLVLDYRLPGLDGLGVLRRLTAEGLPTAVVLLTAEMPETAVVEALRLGARGLVLKEMAPSLIVACIRKVAAGGQWLERDLATRALDRALAGPLPAMEALTAREREIVRLVARGARNREIGQALAIAEGTVKIHLHRIFAKLAVRSRVELANLAHDRFGL